MQTLVKSSVVHLNSYNRALGTIGRPVFTFGEGLLQGTNEDYDEIIMEPLQLVINRDWPTVSSPDNVFQVIAYDKDKCPEDPRNGLLTTYRVSPGYYSWGTGYEAANSWIVWLTRNLPFCQAGFDPCTFRLILVNLNAATTHYMFFFPTSVSTLFGQPIFAQRKLTDYLISDGPARMILESTLHLHCDLPFTNLAVIDNMECDSRTRASTCESSIVLNVDLKGAEPYDLLVWKPTNTTSYRYKITSPQIRKMSCWFKDDLSRDIMPFSDWSFSFKVLFYKFRHTTDPAIAQQLASVVNCLQYSALSKMAAEDEEEEEGGLGDDTPAAAAELA
jgi:hypothetical protein